MVARDSQPLPSNRPSEDRRVRGFLVMPDRLSRNSSCGTGVPVERKEAGAERSMPARHVEGPGIHIVTAAARARYEHDQGVGMQFCALSALSPRPPYSGTSRSSRAIGERGTRLLGNEFSDHGPEHDRTWIPDFGGDHPA